MTSLTNTEYDTEIEEIAADIWEKALTQAEGDKQEAEQLAYEWVCQLVGGHQWIIYTSYHKDVLAFTGNEGAYKDVYGNDDLGAILCEGGLDKLNTIMAHFAMQADILQVLSEIKGDSSNGY